LKSIELVLKGGIALNESIQKILAEKTEIASKLPSLTKRESQLIQLMAQGKTTTTIAEELFLSKFTVDTYRKNLLQKFKVKNSNELLVLLIENKMI
jgi:DNA-binding NarL/FixJ family response regulator